MFPLISFLLLIECPWRDVRLDHSAPAFLDDRQGAQIADLPGIWRLDRFQSDGDDRDPYGRLFIRVDQDGRYVMEDNHALAGSYELVIEKTSELCLHHLTATMGDSKFKGIFYLSHDRLKIAINFLSNERPQSFRADPENQTGLIVYTLTRLSHLDCMLQDTASWLEEAFLGAGDVLEELIIPRRKFPRRAGQIYIKKTGEEIQDWKVMQEISLYSGRELHVWRLRYAEVRLACSGLFECDLWRGIRPRISIDYGDDNSKEFVDTTVEVRVRSVAGKRDK